MCKEISGILEQVFIDQVISRLEKLRSELEFLKKERQNFDEEFFHWSNTKINEINDLIIQYDHTIVGNNVSQFINYGLESLWNDHISLTDLEVLFCGVFYVIGCPNQTCEFLQLSRSEFRELKESTCRKLKVNSTSDMKLIVAHYLKLGVN